MTRAATWRCQTASLDLGRARVVGILNVTPDSFSDGGLHDDADAAVGWGLRLLDEGADVIDVGGESTRPGFVAVDPSVEADRVVPVVSALASAGAVVSIDTRHPQVAEAALAAGAMIVNDVTGFADPRMVDVVASSRCGCVVMRSDQRHFSGGAVGADADGTCFFDRVRSFLLDRAAMLERAGVDRSRICIDPGAGFGSTPEQDLSVQRRFDELVDEGYPCMCAVSRKRVVGALAGVAPAAARDAGSHGMAIAAVSHGVQLVRCHDVAGAAHAIRCAELCLGRAPTRKALVALGSNLGDRTASLSWALDRIDALPGTRVVAASRAYESMPAYVEEQPPFANGVAVVSTELDPMALLAGLLAAEDDAGRVRTVDKGARPLDLDLLWMEGESHAGSRLTLPHPRMGERDFVAVPLAELLGGKAALGRFFVEQGIRACGEEERVGRVVADLGPIREGACR